MAKTSPQNQELQGPPTHWSGCHRPREEKTIRGREEEESAAEGVTEADDLREHLADLHRADRLHRVSDEPHLAPSPSALRRRNHEPRTGPEAAFSARVFFSDRTPADARYCGGSLRHVTVGCTSVNLFWGVGWESGGSNRVGVGLRWAGRNGLRFPFSWWDYKRAGLTVLRIEGYGP